MLKSKNSRVFRRTFLQATGGHGCAAVCYAKDGGKMKVIGLRGCLLASTVTPAIACMILVVGWSIRTPVPAFAEVTTQAFNREVDRILPQEKPYDYHKRLSEGPIHVAGRDPEACAKAGELALPKQGWKLVWNQRSSAVLRNAVQDFQDYLAKSMGVHVKVEGRDSLEGWQSLGRSIVVGTRDQLLGCGTTLKGPKDYEIVATPER